jgi:DNA primase
MQTVLDEAVSLSDMLWRREIGDADLATPERRAGAEANLLRHVGEISDMKVREHYRTLMQQRLRELFAPASGRAAEGSSARRWERQGHGRFAPRGPFKPERPGARPSWTPPVSEAVRRSAAGRGLARTDRPSGSAGEALLLAALTHPFLLEDFAEAIAGLPITEANLDKLRRELLQAASSGQSLDSQGLRDHLRLTGVGDICERLERRPMLKTMAMNRRDTAPHEVLRQFNHVLARHRKLTELEAEYARATEALKHGATEEDVARVRAIEKELTSTAGAEAGPPDAF